MEFEQIVQERYATKLFNGEKILESKVKKLLEMIRLAPSSFNIQPWAIKIITDPDVKEKLSSATWNQPQIVSCSHLLVFCANSNIADHIGKLEKAMIKSGSKPEDVKVYADMMKNFEKHIQELTDKFCKQVDDLLKDKEKDILTI